MAEQLTLQVLKTSTDKKYLSKSVNKIVEKKCRLKDGSSIVNPVVILKKMSDSHTRQFNYAYIKEWGRYYFVNDIVEMPADQIQVSMHVDVLNTYKNNIRGITALIERQENVYSPYFVDEEMLVRTTRFREKKNIGVIGGNTAYYYLTVNNGGD